MSLDAFQAQAQAQLTVVMIPLVIYLYDSKSDTQYSCIKKKKINS